MAVQVDPTEAHTVDTPPLTFVTDDGVSIAGTLYPPVGTPAMTALMLPGIGVPQRAFRHLAGWLSGRGVRCVTVDYRGMGDSRSTEGVASASLTRWARQDAVAVLQYAERHWPEPVVLIGHSFGGQMVGLTRALHRVAAAVFIGSQFGQPRYWDGFAKLRVRAYWRVVLPLASAVFSMVPGWTGLGEPLPNGVANEWARWGRSRGWFLSHEPGAATLLSQFAPPLLAYGISDDNVAPPRAVSALLERFSTTVPVRRTVVPKTLGLRKLGHFGLLRPEATEGVWQDMLDFLRQHVGHDDPAGR